MLGLVQYVDLPPERLASLYRTTIGSAGAPRGLPPFAGPLRDADPTAHVNVGGFAAIDGRAAPHVVPRTTEPVVVRAYALATPEIRCRNAHGKAAVDEFIHLTALDDRAAAEAIAADDLDLLVDLMGHSSYARPGILVYKPARVIATHLGYHGAVGLSQVDFKITDRYADTPASALWQLEAPLPLSVCVLPLRRAAVRDEPALTRAALGIPGDAIVFGAFVGAQKLSPRGIDTRADGSRNR